MHRRLTGCSRNTKITGWGGGGGHSDGCRDPSGSRNVRGLRRAKAGGGAGEDCRSDHDLQQLPESACQGGRLHPEAVGERWGGRGGLVSPLKLGSSVACAVFSQTHLLRRAHAGNVL